jgi:hypothetical protein
MARRKLREQMGDGSLDVLRGPARDRTWEKGQRERGIVVTYRGIPAELRDRLTAIAKENGLPVGDVARAFLECGLGAYGRGELQFERQAAGTRYRLY